MSLPPTRPGAQEPARAPSTFDPAAGPSGGNARNELAGEPEFDEEDEYLTEEELRAPCGPGPSLETFLRCGLLFLLAIALASVLLPAR